MPYLFLTLAFTLNAVANVLLKRGALQGLDMGKGLVLAVLGNWQLIAGLVLFAANVIFYFLALRSLPLSVAYPVMVAMGFIIVNGYAFFALGETIATREIIGYLLIIIGLVLVVVRQT